MHISAMNKHTLQMNTQIQQHWAASSRTSSPAKHVGDIHSNNSSHQKLNVNNTTAKLNPQYANSKVASQPSNRACTVSQHAHHWCNRCVLSLVLCDEWGTNCHFGTNPAWLFGKKCTYCKEMWLLLFRFVLHSPLGGTVALHSSSHHGSRNTD